MHRQLQRMYSCSLLGSLSDRAQHTLPITDNQFGVAGAQVLARAVKWVHLHVLKLKGTTLLHTVVHVLYTGLQAATLPVPCNWLTSS